MDQKQVNDLIDEVKDLNLELAYVHKQLALYENTLFYVVGLATFSAVISIATSCKLILSN